LLHQLYSGLGASIYPLLLLLQPLFEALGGRIALGFAQRLGRYPQPVPAERPGCLTVWIHASSVGEVQAAIVLVTELVRDDPNLRIVVTSTTEQGNRLARSRMPENVSCLMAPLDLPQAVRRALRVLQPDCYICLETELWPVMLTQARKARIPLVLLNGRLSQRSFDRYRHIQGYMASLLDGFAAVAVISEVDGRRYEVLGVPAARIQVCGNLKYDMPAVSPERVRLGSRQRLCAASEQVFLCGSTHEGEETQLLPVFRVLAALGPTVWVIAPRHLERLPAVEAFLARAGLAFDRFSGLSAGGRHASVVLIDTMGDLADLYAGGDYIFCGGSLVPRGGHNIMEAARWGRPVYFGPHMKDFRDAAELLIATGGGFLAHDASGLTALLRHHHDHPEDYRTACLGAAAAAEQQRGAVERQAAIVRQCLASVEKRRA
jgi:3-deoxy-D-manno-octulosonic-acid transferase